MPYLPGRSISPVSSVIALLATLSGTLCAAGPANGEHEPTTRLRRPVALLTLENRLLVGNRRSGTITVLDPATGTILAEHSVATGLADMVRLDDAGRIVVLDDTAGLLWNVSVHDAGREARAEPLATVPAEASRLAVAIGDRRVFVSVKWSEEVISFTLDKDAGRVIHRESIAMPFAPQEILLVDEDRTLLVADAFGGRIATVDTERGGRLTAVHHVHGHNIRGLAASPDGRQLYVAHQILEDRAVADYDELHWGRMIKNVVRVVDLDAVVRVETGRQLTGWLDEQGGIGGATGDPGGLAIGPGGEVAMAFSGVGEVVVRRRGRVKRIPVRARPDAMLVAQDRLYVANRFDDSVSVVDLKRLSVIATIPLGPMPELTAVQRGERLFYDARLSHDGWMSCHSCHTDGHTNGLLVDTLGDGDYGAPKRVPSLLGTGTTGPWGWTGRATTLAAQVRGSVMTTLHGDPLSDAQTADLVAYLESLGAPPRRATQRSASRSRGRAVFESQGCTDCHAGTSLTSEATYSVGLTDERERRTFNPPSLRGVGRRERLFHDGRARGLEDVLLHHRHQLNGTLAAEDLSALLEYLHGL